MNNQAILREYQEILRGIDTELSQETEPVLRKNLLKFRADVKMSIMDLQGQIAMQLKQQENGGAIL